MAVKKNSTFDPIVYYEKQLQKCSTLIFNLGFYICYQKANRKKNVLLKKNRKFCPVCIMLC